MSVYILGMERPTSCHDCRFCGWSNFWKAYDCHMTKNHALLLFNGEKTNRYSETRNGIADNCPLIPVPDHGRLVDADALHYTRVAIWHNDKTMPMGGYVGGMNAVVMSSEIKDAPTIIPADNDEGVDK